MKIFPAKTSYVLVGLLSTATFFTFLYRRHHLSLSLSTEEKHLSMFSECAFYYSFYEDFVSAPTITAGLNLLIHDQRSEYPATINAIHRFNIVPELIFGFLHRVFASLPLPFLPDRWSFYVLSIWALQSVGIGFLSLTASQLGGTVFSGILSTALFVSLTSERLIMRSSSPPLRENIALPFLWMFLWANIMLFSLQKSKKKSQVYFLRLIFTVSATFFQLAWQFAPFILAIVLFTYGALFLLRFPFETFFQRALCDLLLSVGVVLFVMGFQKMLLGSFFVQFLGVLLFYFLVRNWLLSAKERREEREERGETCYQLQDSGEMEDTVEEECGGKEEERKGEKETWGVSAKEHRGEGGELRHRRRGERRDLKMEARLKGHLEDESSEEYVRNRAGEKKEKRKERERRGMVFASVMNFLMHSFFDGILWIILMSGIYLGSASFFDDDQHVFDILRAKLGWSAPNFDALIYLMGGTEFHFLPSFQREMIKNSGVHKILMIFLPFCLLHFIILIKKSYFSPSSPLSYLSSPTLSPSVFWLLFQQIKHTTFLERSAAPRAKDLCHIGPALSLSDKDLSIDSTQASSKSPLERHDRLIETSKAATKEHPHERALHEGKKEVAKRERKTREEERGGEEEGGEEKGEEERGRGERRVEERRGEVEESKRVEEAEQMEGEKIKKMSLLFLIILSFFFTLLMILVSRLRVIALPSLCLLSSLILSPSLSPLTFLPLPSLLSPLSSLYSPFLLVLLLTHLTFPLKELRAPQHAENAASAPILQFIQFTQTTPFFLSSPPPPLFADMTVSSQIRSLSRSLPIIIHPQYEYASNRRLVQLQYSISSCIPLVQLYSILRERFPSLEYLLLNVYRCASPLRGRGERREIGEQGEKGEKAEIDVFDVADAIDKKEFRCSQGSLIYERTCQIIQMENPFFELLYRNGTLALLRIRSAEEIDRECSDCWSYRVSEELRGLRRETEERRGEEEKGGRGVRGEREEREERRGRIIQLEETLMKEISNERNWRTWISNCRKWDLDCALHIAEFARTWLDIYHQKLISHKFYSLALSALDSGEDKTERGEESGGEERGGEERRGDGRGGEERRGEGRGGEEKKGKEEVGEVHFAHHYAEALDYDFGLTSLAEKYYWQSIDEKMLKRHVHKYERRLSSFQEEQGENSPRDNEKQKASSPSELRGDTARSDYGRRDMTSPVSAKKEGDREGQMLSRQKIKLQRKILIETKKLLPVRFIADLILFYEHLRGRRHAFLEIIYLCLIKSVKWIFDVNYLFYKFDGDVIKVKKSNTSAKTATSPSLRTFADLQASFAHQFLKQHRVPHYQEAEHICKIGHFMEQIGEETSQVFRMYLLRARERYEEMERREGEEREGERAAGSYVERHMSPSEKKLLYEILFEKEDPQQEFRYLSSTFLSLAEAAHPNNSCSLQRRSPSFWNDLSLFLYSRPSVTVV